MGGKKINSNKKSKDSKPLFECEGCQRGYRNREDYQDHILSCSKFERPNMHYCSICQTWLYWKHIFDRHVKYEHDEIFTTIYANSQDSDRSPKKKPKK